MRGFTVQISAAAVVIGIIFGAGLLYWGNRFKNLRRTTIILYGILGGGGAGRGRARRQPRPPAAVARRCSAPPWSPPVGLFVLAGATPAALGLLADISERFPNDRGAIMGLYSVFLAVGQIIGASSAGSRPRPRGIDGMLVATAVLLGVALLPLAQLRRDEDELGRPGRSCGRRAA